MLSILGILDNITYNTPHYLDNTSYIILSRCVQPLLDYTEYNYDKLKALIKTDQNKSKVMVFNKNYTHPDLVEKTIDRWFKSYLNTPEYPLSNVNKSYMFSGRYKDEVEMGLPRLLFPYMDYFTKKDKRYNQVVVNYYENENDSIDYHRDWTYGMVKDYQISILNLNARYDGYDGDTKPRMFKIQNIKSGEEFSIELQNGLIITMGGKFQDNFRHGIPKLSNNNIYNSRFGITFRQFR